MGNWGEEEWQKAHADGYKDTVFSITPDQGVRDRTIQEIKHTLTEIPAGMPRILLPACGTAGILERDIAKRISPQPQILCTDFQSVADLARARNTNAAIIYEGRDSRDLGLNAAVDAVVVMNSVVAPEKADNDRMLKSFHKALVPGGALIGLFPTIFCALDVSLTIKNPDIGKAISGCIELEQGMIVDTAHDARQAFYTPLQLRAALLEAGFMPQDIKMDILFMDSPYFQAETTRLYGLQPEDPPIYELFITARKRSTPQPAP